jgi:3'-5' exoribonuclease
MLTAEQIKQMKKGQPGKATLAVLNSEVRETARKSNYLNLTLGDKTGAIPAKIWDWDINTPMDVGEILNVEFEFSPFNDSPQVVVKDYARVDKKGLDAGLFIDSLSKEEFVFYIDELNALIKEIKDKNLRNFVKFVVFDYYPQFKSSVGGKVNHHSKLGGLLQHSVRVTRSAQAMANSYKGTPVYDFVDMDLLIAGGLLHDLGKVGEYTTQNMVIEHTVEGNLTTHYNTGPAYLTQAFMHHVLQDKSAEIGQGRMQALIHIMVTHHGIELSTHSPSTVSAWFIHSADISDCFTDAIVSNLDGKSVMSKDKVWVLKNRVVDERLLR